MRESIMGKLLEKKEMAAIAIVFITVFGLLHFPARSTLPDFSEATLVQSALAGKASPIHSQVAAALVPPYSQITGIAAGSPDSIVSLMLELSPLLLSLAAVFLYLTLRVEGHRRAISAFFAMLVPFLLAVQFLPGAYGAAQLAAPFFALFLLHASISSKGKKPLALAVSLVPAAIAAFIYPPAAIAGIAVCAAIAIPLLSASAKEEQTGAMLMLAPIAAFALAAFFSPSFATLGFSLGNLNTAFLLFPLLIAFAALPPVLFAMRAEPSGLEPALMAIFGVAASAACPSCAAFALAIPAAAGLQAALKDGLPNHAKLAFALAFGFFAVFAVVYSGGDSIRAAAIALMVCVMFPLTMHFYDYQNAKFFAVLSLASLLFAVFALALAPYSQYSPRHLSYSDKDFSLALSSLSKSGAAQGAEVCLLGNEGMAKFYLPGATLCRQDNLTAYLADGSNAPAKGSILLLSPSYLDSGDWTAGASGFTAYVFNSNVTAKDGSGYAIFAGSGGGVLRQVDSQGSFVLRDGSLLDSSGSQYFTVPYSRMVLLRPGMPYYSPANRLLVLEDGATPPFVSKIYSGQAGGLSKLSEFGMVAIYEVD